MKFIENELSKEQLVIWNKAYVGSETRRKLAQTLINKKIKEDSEYEVWVEIFYFPLIKGVSKKLSVRKAGLYKNMFISNLGNVFNNNTKQSVATSGKKDSYVFAIIGEDIDKNRIKGTIHRLVAGAFCSKPRRHRDIKLTELQVNHKNGDKTCNDSWNLEWVTNGENQIHAHKTGLQPNLKGINKVGSIPMKGTVVDIPEHNGKVIVVCGGDDYKEFGLYANSLWQIREGKMSKHKGCTWEVCDIQEYSRLKAFNCTELAKAMKEFVTVITYRLTHKETGHVIDGLTGMQLRDQYGFNDTHLKGTWKKQGTIKGYSVQRYEDGEELIPPAKPIQQIKRWVLVGENKAGIIKINKSEDFTVYGFNKANVMRSMKLGFKATHPTTGVKYNVLEANFKK